MVSLRAQLPVSSFYEICRPCFESSPPLGKKLAVADPLHFKLCLHHGRAFPPAKREGVSSGAGLLGASLGSRS